jgi:hypothetical protein
VARCTVERLMGVLLALTSLASTTQNRHPDPELRRLLSEAIKSADSFDDRFDAEVWLVNMSARLAP